jgi:gliding motility-associated-like protein
MNVKDMKALRFISTTKKLLLFIFLCGIIQGAFSQKLTTNNWYFGNTINGIKFNRGTSKAEAVTNKATPFGTGGSAVATDPANGNLLFYTDGNLVYDACHFQMPNGTGLSGNTAASQPVVISAIPGQPNKYYIFTNSASYTAGGTVSVSIVDLTSTSFGNATFPNPPLGDVTSKNIAISNLTGRSEGMAILPHADGINFWLITHKNSSADYSATLIDGTGVFVTTTTTSIGSPSGIPLSVANFAVSPLVDPASPNLRKIAVAPQTGNDDAIIVSFNNSTGIFTFDSYIFNTGKPTVEQQAIYDIEWNAKGQYLYLSYFGDTGITADVLQYDSKNPSITLTSVLPASLKPTQSLGLQVGADSAMYYLYKTASGKFQVGSFTKTDTIASQVKFDPQPLGAIDFIGTQFPSFLPDKDLNISVTFVPISTCQNAPTAFYPTVTPNADSVAWDFGDGSFSKAWSPVHTFANAGTSNVSITAFLQGQRKTTTIPITVRAFALKITLVQDTTACRDEFPPKRGKALPVQFSVTAKVEGGTPASSDWSNGQKGLILKPDSAGYYYLTISDGLGCAVSAGVNVKEYGLNDQRSNKWYFGNKAGIDFTTNRALADGGMTAPEGCAIVCDRNGQTIFYTDGDKVYDRTNVVTANGTALGGSPGGLSSQSSLIFPVPGDETLYYIFTTQALNETGSNNEVRYSLFDWKLNGGKGDIAQKNVLLFSKSTERITANGNWVVFHEYGNSFFRSYRITQAGIGSPVFSSIGSDHSQCEGSGDGYMRLGPNNTLAVPLSYNGGNFIELFHLNDTTGRIVKFSKDDANNRLDLKESAGTVYGVEFANSNKKGLKLYATVNNGASSKLVEFAIDSLSKSTLFTPKITAPNLGAIQTAPNGAIYVAVKDANSLSQIVPASDLTIKSNLQADAFPLATGTTSLLGLPNFRQQQGNGFGGPSFSFTGVCVGDSTKFTGQGTDSIDKYAWSFGDGGSSTDQSPAHLYAKAGTYNVTFRVYNRCSLDTTLTAKVTVFDPPAKPSLSSATVLCNGPVTLDANKPNTSGLTYTWSTGETTKTIVVNRDLAVSVTNTDVNGCFSRASSLVVDNRPQVDLGPDQTVCQNNAVNVLDAGNPGATYVWKLKDETTGTITNGGTIQQQAVDTALPSKTTYTVTVTDPITTCAVTDAVTFSVNVSPDFKLVGSNPTGCGSPTGTVELTINNTTPAGGAYSYFITGPGTPPETSFNQQAIDQPAGTTVPFTNLPAGTFSGVVTDQISGCSISQSIGLTDASWGITSIGSNCDKSSVTITASPISPSTTLPVYPITYTFTRTGGPKADSTFTTLPIMANPAVVLVPQGNWTVQATDASTPGCTATDLTPLVVTPNPTISITPNASCNSLTANFSVPGSYKVDWTLPGGGILNDVTTINAIASGTYVATATKIGVSPTCSFSSSYNITVINPTIKQSDPCSDQVILTASPAGNYLYSWQKGGVAQPSLVGQQIALAVGDGGAYNVSLRDTDTGCTYSSTPAFNATVVGTITASLSSTPPCKDGKAFTLTTTSTPSTGLNYAWTLNGSTITGATATINQSTEGKYQVTVSSAVAPECKSQPSITIVRNPIPEGNLPPAAIICADPDNKDPATAKVELNPGTFLQYQWYKNEVLLSAETKQKLNVTSPGLYRVDITNSYNCTSSDKTEVRNECIPKLVAPSAFRPGSKEATNQNFFVYSFFITDQFEVSIFNRWGELIYESKDKNFKWNGTYNNQGQPLPPGTYAYSIKYISSFRPDKGVQEQRGGVVLIR